MTPDTWDAVGNLVQEIAYFTQTYTYDADNELTHMSASNGFWITYAYDQNGNQIAYQTSTHESDTMTYDYENRLIVDGGCTYTYTPSGDRASDSCITPAPNERYDAAAPSSASNLIVQYNATGARKDRYVSAGTDQPVEMVSGSTAYWYATDGLGSVTRLTNATGGTAETYAYDVWGGTTASGGVSNPLEFTARSVDSSGLYDDRARSYDPSSNGGHRFTSQDPLGGGYAYVGDSPANFVDPSGRMRAAPRAGGGSSPDTYCDGWAAARGLCSTMSSEGATPLAPPSGGYDWGKCAGQLVVFAATVALAVLGLAADPMQVAARVAGQTAISELFLGLGAASALTGWGADLVEIQKHHGSFVDALSYWLDFSWFVFTQVIVPSMNWGDALILGAQEAAHFTPVGLAVYAAVAAAMSVIALLSLEEAGCGL